MDFLSSSLRSLRSALSRPALTYLNWLKKVEAKKSQHWKDLGIFDLIQLLKTGLKFDETLLLTAMHFWEGSTNTLQLKRGMLTPMLVYITIRMRARRG